MDLRQYVPPEFRGAYDMASTAGGGIYNLLSSFQQDPAGTNKAMGRGMIDSAAGFARDPVGTVKDFAGTVGRGLTYTAADKLMDMFGVETRDATSDQLKQANRALAEDRLAALALAPGVGPGGKALISGAKAANRLEVDPNSMGSLLGNVRLRPEVSQGDTQIMRGSDYFDAPRAGGGRAKDPALFTPFSQNVKQKTAPYNWEVETNPVDAGYTAPALISPSDLQGTDMYFLAGDRTAGGREVTRVGQLQLQRPVRLEAGGEYMDTQDVWASHSGVMKPKQNVFTDPANEGRDIRVGFSPMGERSGDFAKHQGQLYSEMLYSSQMPKKTVKQVNAELRSVVGDFRQKTLARKNKQREKEGLKPLTRVTLSDIPSVDSPDFRDWFDTQSPEQVRKPFLQRMDKADMKQLEGLPDAGEMRFAATNPDLVQSPSFSSGYRFATPDISRGLLSADHPSYDTKISKMPGTGSQTFGADVPWTISARDTALPRLAAAAKEKGTFYPGQNMPFSGRAYTLPSDQRVFTMNPKTKQFNDQQYVDEASTYIDRLKRGGLEDATRYEMNLIEAYLRGL
jgi:hypothetical protein